ncbi:hypothetical protein OROGR_009508 [Orobanche gracilis]
MTSDVERVEEEESASELLRDRFRLCTISIAEIEAKRNGMEVSPPIMSCISDLAFKYALTSDVERVEEEESTSELLRDRFRLCTISIAEIEAKRNGTEVSPPIMSCISDLAFKYAHVERVEEEEESASELLRDRFRLCTISIAEIEAKRNGTEVSPPIMSCISDLAFKYALTSDVERVEEEESTSELLRDRFRLCTISIAEIEAKRNGTEVSPPIMSCISDLAFKYARDDVERVEEEEESASELLRDRFRLCTISIAEIERSEMAWKFLHPLCPVSPI